MSDLYKASAFGHPCKSLKQVTQDLVLLLERNPGLADDPVWVFMPNNSDGVAYRPVDRVGLVSTRRGPDIRTVISVIGQ